MKEKFPYAVILRIARGALLYLLFMLLALCSGTFFVPDNGAELELELKMLPYIISTVFTPIALDIAVRIFSENDPLLRSEENFTGGKRRPFRENARYILSLKEFYIEVGTLCALCLVLPLESAYYPMMVWLLRGVPGRALKKLIVMAIMCPVFFGVEFIGWFFSLVGWQQKRFIEPLRHPNLRILLSSTVWFLLLLPGFLALSYMMAVPLTIFYGFMGREWLYVAIPVCVCVTLFLCWFFRSLRARARYMRKLKKRCKAAGFHLSHVHRPILSLLRNTNRINFIIEGNGKSYVCKLVGSMQRDCPIYISEKGVYYCLHALRIRNTQVLQYITSCRFGFEADGVKVLIVNPTPDEIYAGTPEFYRQIYTGETVGEYKIFEGVPFLNALERDCVERDPNRPNKA